MNPAENQSDKKDKTGLDKLSEDAGKIPNMLKEVADLVKNLGNKEGETDGDE